MQAEGTQEGIKSCSKFVTASAISCSCSCTRLSASCRARTPTDRMVNEDGRAAHKHGSVRTVVPIAHQQKRPFPEDREGRLTQVSAAHGGISASWMLADELQRLVQVDALSPG